MGPALEIGQQQGPALFFLQLIKALVQRLILIDLVRNLLRIWPIVGKPVQVVDGGSVDLRTLRRIMSMA